MSRKGQENEFCNSIGEVVELCVQITKKTPEPIYRSIDVSRNGEPDDDTMAEK